MRFKPPSNAEMGWRVEFRSMDIQLTDQENAAFSIFVVLLAKTILHFSLDLYMPLSKVDQNMSRAHKMDALNTQKFWFRDSFEQETTVSEHSLQVIMNSEKNGLVTLVDRYIDEMTDNKVERLKLKRYTDIIRQKANGKRQTCATYIRNFVQKHPDYKKDSKISEQINLDLCRHIIQVQPYDLVVSSLKTE